MFQGDFFFKAQTPLPLTFDLAGRFNATTPWQHLPRVNANYELFIGVQETLYLTIEGQSVSLQPGDVLLIPPEVAFTGSQDSLSGLSFYWLHFSLPPAAGKLLRLSQPEERHGQPLLVPLYGERLATANELILFQQMLLAMKNVAWQPDLLAAFATTILLSLSAQTKKQVSQKPPAPGQQIIAFVAEWLQNNLAQAITVQEVANHFGYNKVYLSNLFSTQMGTTMTNYLQHLRIEEAKKLLVTSPLTIKELAKEVGFHDEKYFSRVFKTFENQAPTAYRQHHLKLEQ